MRQRRHSWRLLPTDQRPPRPAAAAKRLQCRGSRVPPGVADRPSRRCPLARQSCPRLRHTRAAGLSRRSCRWMRHASGPPRRQRPKPRHLRQESARQEQTAACTAAQAACREGSSLRQGVLRARRAAGWACAAAAACSARMGSPSHARLAAPSSLILSGDTLQTEQLQKQKRKMSMSQAVACKHRRPGQAPPGGRPAVERARGFARAGASARQG